MRADSGEDKRIDYVVDLVDLNWYYYAIAVGLFVCVGLIWKRWRIAALIAYVFFIIAVTVLSRRPFMGNHIELRPLWSWSVPRLREQVIMNVIGFIPVGIIGGSLWKWKIVPIAAGISLCVELIQLLTKTGLFEIDDILHNTFGAAIGFGLFLVVKRIKVRKITT